MDHISILDRRWTSTRRRKRVLRHANSQVDLIILLDYSHLHLRVLFPSRVTSFAEHVLVILKGLRVRKQPLPAEQMVCYL